MKYEDYKVENLTFLTKEDWTEEEKKEFLDTCPEGRNILEKIEALYALLDAIEDGEVKLKTWGDINLGSGAAYGKRNHNIFYVSEQYYGCKSLCIFADGKERYITDKRDISNLIEDLRDTNKRFDKIKSIYTKQETSYKYQHEKESYEEANRERIIANRIAYEWLDTIRLDIPTEIKERERWYKKEELPDFEAEYQSFRGYELVNRNKYGELMFYDKIVSKEDAQYISTIIERVAWDLLAVMKKCKAAIKHVKGKYKEV